ncbi:Predicted ATPase [Oligella ureolytica]|uniref:ATP-binding protein n=1 Tax=Oligella ureolytica TaxID=90244 RepID=A0A378XGP5_9BURK|nr:ATP-binding protein [Oligella ureolytica]QPT41177.1 ATP-binding protein [Oligella ureolytica]SUA53968.1 Predicted ATPase [Oligella ureolytica]SUA55326.1 Predicted ATPase [Oligella ureolytica]
MLLEVAIANCYSYAERQTLSLIANSSQEHEHSHVAHIQAARSYRVLRSAAIYGANSSGKSNFLIALNKMRYLVLRSVNFQRGDKLDIVPFRLDSMSRALPSEFEVQFIAEGVRYQYGFSATNEHIHDEWLFAFPKGQAQTWFQRVWDDKQQKHIWHFGNYFQGEKSLWQKSTRENALFLSTAVQLNSQQLQPIFDWFQQTLRFIGVKGIHPFVTAETIRTGNKEQILNHLRAVDNHLADVTIDNIPLEESIPEKLPAELRKILLSTNKNDSTLSIKMQRVDNQGQTVEFSFEDESDGTQKFFCLIGPWLDALENGYVLFVDELHNSLHTHLVHFLIKLFNHPNSNPNNAQLIFTTHDTNQLDSELLRRDQIWFCEKDAKQATQLYPLTDFKVRKGHQNLEAAYLSGRYGATPFIEEFM